MHWINYARSSNHTSTMLFLWVSATEYVSSSFIIHASSILQPTAIYWKRHYPFRDSRVCEMKHLLKTKHRVYFCFWISSILVGQTECSLKITTQKFGDLKYLARILQARIGTVTSAFWNGNLRFVSVKTLKISGTNNIGSHVACTKQFYLVHCPPEFASFRSRYLVELK